jgi:acyl carrier protein
LSLPGGLEGKEKDMGESKNEIFQAVKEHLAGRGVEQEKVTMDATLVEDLGFDSLEITELTLGLEERYGIEIPDEDLEGLSTVGDAVQLIETKVAAHA